MTPLAPLISAFLNQRLPLERRASDHTCEAYAYAFQLLFVYAAERLKVPIRFIGVGEAAEDLRPFVAGEFIQALFDRG